MLLFYQENICFSSGFLYLKNIYANVALVLFLDIPVVNILFLSFFFTWFVSVFGHCLHNFLEFNQLFRFNTGVTGPLCSV